MMNMVKRFISTLVLVVALVGTVSAQSLDDLSKKVLDLSFGVINKGINAYEEQLEKQELEEALEAKKALEEAKKAVEEAKKAVEEAKKAEEDNFEVKKAEEEAKKAIKEASKAIKEAKKAVEEAKKAEEDNFEENCNILYDAAIGYFLEHDAWVKCYCPPVGDYIWYTIFYGDDNNWWINLAYDSNGSISETFYTTKIEKLDYLIFKDDISEKKIAAIELDDYIVVLQDAHNPEIFTINW